MKCDALVSSLSLFAEVNFLTDFLTDYLMAKLQYGKHVARSTTGVAGKPQRSLKANANRRHLKHVMGRYLI